MCARYTIKNPEKYSLIHLKQFSPRDAHRNTLQNLNMQARVHARMHAHTHTQSPTSDLVNQDLWG